MAIDLTGTADTAACFPAEIAGTDYRRAAGYWAASVFALAAYVGAIIWILSSSTAKVYGFPVSHDLATLIEITLQVGPMLAAFFMVLLLPVKDRIIESMAGCDHPARRVGVTLGMLITYATAPLYDGAAWLLRAYWAGITGLMLSVLYAFDRPPRSLLAGIADCIRNRELRPRAAWRLSLVLSVVCIAIGAGLVKLQAYGITRYQAPSQAVLDAALQGARETARFHLTHFDVRLNYQGKEEVGVDGELAFRNGDQPARSAYFQLPGLMAPEQIQILGGGDYRLVPLGKYIQVKFSGAIPPLQEVRVRYRGSVRPAGAFDLAVQSKVLSRAFFLTDADLLLAARSPACLASPGAECGNAENYLMSDRATGRMTVIAPQRLGVVSAGDESTRQLSDGRSEHVFTVGAPRLATFLVACAPFRESVAVAGKSGVRVRVLRSATAAADGDVEAPLAEKILSFYETVWPAYPRRDLKIVETPTPLGEAMAFDGEIAISDKIIVSRSPMAGTASNLLEFVMAHEIAHQWWGFSVVPSNSPGRLFVLESIPQFAAYKFLGSRGILGEQTARQNEERRYQAARGRLRNREVPLIRSEIADEVAYNKGPFALLSIDQMGSGSMMNRLGGFILGNSYEMHGAAAPEQLAAALIADLPKANRETARSLLYGAGQAARP
jgi:hypothetical protein